MSRISAGMVVAKFVNAPCSRALRRVPATRVQESAPEHVYVILGHGEPRRFRVDDYSAYYRHRKESFLHNCERGRDFASSGAKMTTI